MFFVNWVIGSFDGPIRHDAGDSTVVLVDPGRRVVAVVAAVQKLTGLEYGEVGELLKDWLTPVLTAVSDEVADRAQQALESAGATVLIGTHVSA